MRARWLVCLLLAVSFGSVATPAAAFDADRSIVRTKTGLDGWTTIDSLCGLLGCEVLGSLDTLPLAGRTVPSSLFLVRALPATDPASLNLLGVASVEPDLLVPLTQSSYLVDQASVAVLDDLSLKRTPTDYYGTLAWESYLAQPAVDIVRLRETHCAFGVTGGGIVAVIDSGVDPDHPTLQPRLTEGWDFTRDVAGGNEMADLAQASVAVLDQVYWVGPATAAVLDQASVAVLDDPEHAAFGHGTMVAGIVHLAAPGAQIMPLKAFGADGQGYTSNIIRAIYYAVYKGAKVLNMSFSGSTASPEIQQALDVATSHGLIAVASAGNNGSTALVYPAAFGNVMGVASTRNDDQRSSFSNYGPDLVWVAAPGEGIVSTYPWGSFAAAWGTSFSTPFVSGAAALLVGVNGTADHSQVSSAVSHAKPLSSDLGLGYGRLDVYQAVLDWSAWSGTILPESCAAQNDDGPETQ